MVCTGGVRLGLDSGQHRTSAVHASLSEPEVRVVFDTRPALADMANQIRTCRGSDGLTLQQLASRSGVAASTIHKVEAQQMVPTVSVLLKIARGLGRRPEELIRDDFAAPGSGNRQAADSASSGTLASDGPERAVGVWKIDLDRDHSLPPLDLDPRQRAIVLVEQGAVELQSDEEKIPMKAGDCVEIGGGHRLRSDGAQLDPARLTLIVTPPGDFGDHLGAPSAQLSR